MSAIIVDGPALAARRLGRLATRVAALKSPPGYGLVLVGADAQARRSAHAQEQACQQAGLRFHLLDLPGDLTTAQISREVVRLGQDPGVHGVVLQQPFPESVDYHEVTRWLPQEKDVDACHPLSQADLFRAETEPRFLPAAAAACLAVLEDSGVKLAGASVAVLGKNPLGRVAGNLLVRREAIVDVHPRAERTQADIVLCGLGEPRAVTASMVKPGAAVVDLGEDVDVAGVSQTAGWLVQGVEPMALAILMEQTVRAAAP